MHMSSKCESRPSLHRYDCQCSDAETVRHPGRDLDFWYWLFSHCSPPLPSTSSVTAEFSIGGRSFCIAASRFTTMLSSHHTALFLCIEVSENIRTKWKLAETVWVVIRATLCFHSRSGKHQGRLATSLAERAQSPPVVRPSLVELL